MSYRNLLEPDSSLQGRNLSATAPTSGQALIWNDTTKRWEPGAGAGTPPLSSPGAGSGSEAFGLSSAAAGADAVALGRLASASTIRDIAIGRGATASGGNSLAIGDNAICSGASSIAIGKDSSVPGLSNVMSVGSAANAISLVFFGGGVSSTATPFTISGSRGTNDNNAGSDVSIAGGPGKGIGAPGSVKLQTPVLAASGGTVQSLVDRLYVNSVRKTLTDALTNLFEVALPTLKGFSCLVSYEIFATNGTDVQVRHGIVRLASVNKAGAYTSDATVVSEGVAASAGTLTATFAITGGTDKVTISVTPAGSLTETTYYILYTITNNSEQAITIL